MSLSLPSSMIEIHEFSTGILSQKTADGGWVSLGFTGQYMNVTVENIPEAIERSIVNREFAVAEGASRDNPAVIGRVIKGGDDTWSVMAVVSRGRDEKGRSASMYRYFFCHGEHSLKDIINWWESKRRPVFNPLETKNTRQSHLFNTASISATEPQAEALALPMYKSEPMLLRPEQQYDLRTIHTLANRKINSHNKGELVSWAFNVEALEKPWRFQVIQAASTPAYEILKRTISNTPQIVAPVVIDEAALKSAIRGLMNSSQVKLEFVKVIVDALNNNQIPTEYWHTLFDAEGAKTAITQNFYSPAMIKLVTLRAIVIPETLLEYISWLNIKPDKKPDENQTIALKFQQEIREEFPKEKLADGIKSLLPKLCNLPPQITPKSVCWILTYRASAWILCSQEIINDISSDLRLINTYHSQTGSYHYSNSGTHTSDSPKFPVNELKCYTELWISLINHWRNLGNNYKKLKKYKPLAQLLEKLYQRSNSSRACELSAFFYQVSDGKVPRKLYNKINQLQESHYSPQIFELRLEPDVSLVESIVSFFLKGEIVPLNLVATLIIAMSIIMFFSGFLLGSEMDFPFLWHQKSEDTSKSQEKSGNQIAEEKAIRTAIHDGNFNKTTKEGVERIINDVKNNVPGSTKKEIIQTINNVLKVDMDNANVDHQGEDRRKAEAIYKFQSDNALKQDGYLRDETIEELERRVEEKIN